METVKTALSNTLKLKQRKENSMLKILLIIIIILNIILSIYLGIKVSQYKILSEDDKSYIETIKQLKEKQNSVENQISKKNKELNNINKKIQEYEKVLEGNAKYIMKINISQSHFTLDISEHLKDSMNEIEIYVETSKEFYDKYNVGDIIADDFRVGSLIFKGSFGNWEVKVADKQIV